MQGPVGTAAFLVQRLVSGITVAIAVSVLAVTVLAVAIALASVSVSAVVAVIAVVALVPCDDTIVDESQKRGTQELEVRDEAREGPLGRDAGSDQQDETVEVLGQVGELGTV